MSAWISMLSDAQADDDLLDALTLARTPHGTVDNVMRVHSHRPNTLRGHVTLYRAALHDDKNTVPTWFQETIASYVSMLNQCPYSLANHWANARHLIGDEARADDIEQALRADQPESVFSDQHTVALQYAKKLTLAPGDVKEEDVVALRTQGWNDGEILEINQIIAYFNYVNRQLNGLGVTTDGDTVGYYASSSADETT